ncbi:hypothetical protein ColTof3_14805 [Colletotrichum tofieldiae]|nr:hypothetical protein ColTof3_14805 [Colletotrichum tofieldiae]
MAVNDILRRLNSASSATRGDDKTFELWHRLDTEFRLDPDHAEDDFALWAVLNVKRDVLILVTSRSLPDEVRNIRSDIASRWAKAVKRHNLSLGIIALLFGKDIVSSRCCATALSQLSKLREDIDPVRLYELFANQPTTIYGRRPQSDITRLRKVVEACAPGCWPKRTKRECDEIPSIDKPRQHENKLDEANKADMTNEVPMAATTPSEPVEDTPEHPETPEPPEVLKPPETPEVARRSVHHHLSPSRLSFLGGENLTSPEDTQKEDAPNSPLLSEQDDNYSDFSLDGGLDYSDDDEDFTNASDNGATFKPDHSLGDDEGLPSFMEEDTSKKLSYPATTPRPSVSLFSRDGSYHSLGNSEDPLRNVNMGGPRRRQKRVIDQLEQLPPRDKAKKPRVTFDLEPPLQKESTRVFDLPPAPSIEKHGECNESLTKVSRRSSLECIVNSLPCLCPSVWLNDVVIHTMSRRLESPDVGVIDSLTIAAFARGRNIEGGFRRKLQPTIQKAKVLILFNIDNTHWVVFLWTRADSTLTEFDSAAPVPARPHTIDNPVPEFLRWITDEPELEVISRAVEPNSSDCGVYTLMLAHTIATDRAIPSEIDGKLARECIRRALLTSWDTTPTLHEWTRFGTATGPQTTMQRSSQISALFQRQKQFRGLLRDSSGLGGQGVSTSGLMQEEVTQLRIMAESDRQRQTILALTGLLVEVHNTHENALIDALATEKEVQETRSLRLLEAEVRGRVAGFLSSMAALSAAQAAINRPTRSAGGGMMNRCQVMRDIALLGNDDWVSGTDEPETQKKDVQSGKSSISSSI